MHVRNGEIRSHLGLALAGFRTEVAGHCNGGRRGDTLLTFLLGMGSLDLVRGGLEKANDLGFAHGSLIPDLWEELALSEGEFRELAIGIEEGILKVDVVDEVGHYVDKIAAVEFTPGLKGVTMVYDMENFIG